MYYTQGKVLREKDVFLCVQITVCKSKYCISSDEKVYTVHRTNQHTEFLTIHQFAHDIYNRGYLH